MYTGDQKREYDREYKRRNREQINARRRELYAADPERSRSQVAKTKAWREANPEKYQAQLVARDREKVNERSREWYRANLERAKATQRRNKLKREYGLTLEQFDAMLTAQSGLCAICGRSMTPPHVDHDHTTGAVRGLLCQPCNTALGLLQDSTETLAAALRYLTSSSSGVTSTTNSERSNED